MFISLLDFHSEIGLLGNSAALCYMPTRVQDSLRSCQMCPTLAVNHLEQPEHCGVSTRWP